VKIEIQEHLIRVLSAFDEPVDFNKINASLKHQYKDRSLRRWLSELADKNLIIKTGQKKGTRYQIITREDNFLNNQQSNLESIHNDFSRYLGVSARKAIDDIRRPLFTRSPVTYNDDWIESYIPNQTFYLPPDTREELSVIGISNMSNERAGTYAKKIFNRLLIDLSYNSARLEGNTYSLVDTEKLIIEGISQDGKLDEERVMILNHKEAIRYLVDRAESIAINPTEICTLHYLLADGLVNPNYAGHVRKEGVRISSSTYQPLENPEHLTRRLGTICEKAAAIHDPFEQSIFLLAHIAYLQAFIDVNKRTSRLSANIPLIKHNHIPLSFNDVDKDYYASAMISIYELNDIHALTDIYCFSYRRSCEHYKITSEVVGFDEIRVRYRSQRREMIRAIIQKQLIGDELTQFINNKAVSSIPAEDVESFKISLHDDLISMNPAQIQGMGITQKELFHWLKLK